MSDFLTQTPLSSIWQNVGPRAHHGINTPLFSLRSETSCGIGEFYDLFGLIDLCQKTGFDTIQLLPINDTGLDSSPYNPISSLALNPIHLSLAPLATDSLKELLEPFHQLNQKESIDWLEVRHYKHQFLQAYFWKEFPKISKTSDYQEFIQENSWLYSYALFKALKDQYHWIDSNLWPEELRVYQKEKKASLIEKHQEKIDFLIFIQYLCFSQMKTVSSYAKEHNIHLMGDLPILISRESADVWEFPELFDSSFSVGAPPDYYSPDGQNWGFPAYQWHNLEKEDFHWWKRRLKVAENFYDLYRIDHIIGFYRLWTIPQGKTATEGFYTPNKEIISHGEKILKILIESSNMLPIGEDLGAIPFEVKESLQRLGISSTQVIRWEKNWGETSSFIPLDEYKQAGLSTLSTHDSSSLALFWQEEQEEAKQLATFMDCPYQEELSCDMAAHILQKAHGACNFFHIHLLGEYLFAANLIPIDEAKKRINLPGTISSENWSYRYSITVEKMVESHQLMDIMRSCYSSKVEKPARASEIE